MLDRPAMADNVIEEIANSQHARRRARRLDPRDAFSLLQHRSTFQYVLSELPRTHARRRAGGSRRLCYCAAQCAFTVLSGV